MVPVFNSLHAANREIYIGFRLTPFHSGCTVVLTVMTFAIQKYYIQLIRSIGVAKGEKDVGYYVGLLVRAVVFYLIYGFLLT